MKILIAEDDSNIANSLSKSFNDEKIQTVIAGDGEQALQFVNTDNFDILLLDWRMPKKDGLEVCKLIRLSGSSLPIILLTALSDISNKVEALNLGADDYITKPFSFPEVLARINAVLRRRNSNKLEITIGKMKINLVEHKLFIDGNEIKLTEKEFELLNHFIENKGVILSKEELCKNVWHYDFIPETNIVESAVKNLRRKIEEHCNKKLIKNVYGEGYIFIEE